MAIRIDLVNDLRETVSYRISVHDDSLEETINCSNLVGNSATLGTPRLELIGLESNLDNHFSIFNISSNSTENLTFSVGSGQTKINFSSPIIDQSITKSSLVKVICHGGNASGYVLLTFAKKEGFERVGSARRKIMRPNAYR